MLDGLKLRPNLPHSARPVRRDQLQGQAADTLLQRLICPSEVQTAFFDRARQHQEPSPKKLRPQEIGAAVVGVLEMDERGFVPELAVFATNPF